MYEINRRLYLHQILYPRLASTPEVELECKSDWIAKAVTQNSNNFVVGI